MLETEKQGRYYFRWNGRAGSSLFPSLHTCQRDLRRYHLNSLKWLLPISRIKEWRGDLLRILYGRKLDR